MHPAGPHLYSGLSEFYGHSNLTAFRRLAEIFIMAVQQNKKSKQKVRQRQAANRYKGVQPGKCSHCGAPVIPHRVCEECGYYKDKQILDVTVD